MFGRKKKNDAVDETSPFQPKKEELDEQQDLDDETESHAPGDEDEVEADREDSRDDDEVAELYRPNLERVDGPFDYEEVDLDADEIERIDFGSLILTPFENMQMQIQLDQQSGAVQSLLIMQGGSALEVALFAAPSTGLIIDDVHRDMMSGTASEGGEANVGPGPLGAELRRIVPVKTPEGQEGYHVSRTWLVQGPRWLLRGVLMGEAAFQEDLNATGQLLLEFFCNLVVRRDDSPRVPGDLITLQVPNQLRADEQQQQQ